MDSGIDLFRIMAKRRKLTCDVARRHFRFDANKQAVKKARLSDCSRNRGRLSRAAKIPFRNRIRQAELASPRIVDYRSAEGRAERLPIPVAPG